MSEIEEAITKWEIEFGIAQPYIFECSICLKTSEVRHYQIEDNMVKWHCPVCHTFNWMHRSVVENRKTSGGASRLGK